MTSFLASMSVATVVLVGYFVLPFTSRLAVDTVAELLLGLLAIAGLLAWQVHSILVSPVPGVRAVGALSVSAPLFLTLFATAYFIMGSAQPGTFSEPMSRLDALYFSVTTFATVGFGDITAVSPSARAVVTVQMVGDLVLVGLIARVIFGAVEHSRSRQERPTPPNA